MTTIVKVLTIVYHIGHYMGTHPWAAITVFVIVTSVFVWVLWLVHQNPSKHLTERHPHWLPRLVRRILW